MSVRRAIQDSIILLLVCTTQAVLVNISIDDTYGDHSTGQKPVYQPSDIWFGPSCDETRCFVQPNASLAYDNTWTAAVYTSSTKNMNVTFSFTGVSIWVFFILSNNGDVGGTLSVPTSTECNFTIDGDHMGAFSYQPGGAEAARDIQYNATVFSVSGLSNSQHELVISTSGAPNMTYVNFDYAIYTADVPDSATSSTSTHLLPSSTSGIHGSTEAHHPSSNRTLGIVIGCVLGGLGVALVGALILFGRLQRKSKGPILTSFNQQPSQGYRDEIADSNAHLPLQNFIYNENPSTGTLYDRRIRVFSPADESAASIPVRRENQSPHAHSTKNQDELRSVRQMEINQQLQTAQQEILNLTSRQSAMGGGPAPGLSLSSEARQQEMEHEMHMANMRERTHQLRIRIEQLQMERSSDWAQGLSDDPPPAYYSLS